MDAKISRLTPLQYTNAKPVPPIFSVKGSIASILSLIFMSVVSLVMYLQLINPENNLIAPVQAIIGNNWLGHSLNILRPPNANTELATWTQIPFLFSIFGATLGWIFELNLLLSGTPFQQQKNLLSQWIQKVRFLNLAPVLTSIFFFVCTMMISDPHLRLAMMLVSGAACSGLGFALFFGGGGGTIPMIMLGTQLLQIIIVLVADIPVGGGFLIAQAVFQLTAFLIGTATPIRSTAFHVISTFSGVMLYSALLQTSGINADYSQQVATLLPAGSLAKWLFIGSVIAGLWLTLKVIPLTYGYFRTTLSSTVWTPLYYLLVGGPRFPDPFSLTDVFKDNQPVKTYLKPYYLVHPEHLSQKLSIPAVAIDNIERNVTMFTGLVKQAKKLFKFLAMLDQIVPQANITIPIKNKERMPIWSDGSDYWPKLFSKKIFGLSIPSAGQYLEKAPLPALENFREGQLLGYLFESGIANPFLEPAPERGEGALQADFRFLEKYETKDDYESYGGIAYFKVNSEKQKLELVSVVAPHSQKEILANPNDPSFRNAEGLVLASMYYQVISGKHLAEIHMTLNLVEVAMHNAFDVQDQWSHPFRTFMYLHFFSHELAEEITTEHLVQDGSVFSQIFATTHDSLIQHLNDCYSNFEYGKDESFEKRKAMMTLPSGKILPNACINWELEYFEIWHKYTTQLIDIIYIDDEAVQADNNLQGFHSGLLEVMLNGMPQRYDEFQTKKGIARFAADTMHHTIIRHQVYGTTGIKAALDPRISKTQVPRDTGTCPINEWRSLACVALATGQSRFTLLMGENGKDFTYLLEGLEESVRTPMAKVFDQLQTDLKELDDKWTEDDEQKTFNYNYFRAIPSELHTGPGY